MVSQEKSLEITKEYRKSDSVRRVRGKFEWLLSQLWDIGTLNEGLPPNPDDATPEPPSPGKEATTPAQSQPGAQQPAVQQPMGPAVEAVVTEGVGGAAGQPAVAAAEPEPKKKGRGRPKKRATSMSDEGAGLLAAVRPRYWSPAKSEQTTVEPRAAREKRSAFAALKKVWNSEVPAVQRGGDPMVPYILKFRDLGAKMAGYFSAERNYAQSVLLQKLQSRLAGRRGEALPAVDPRFTHTHDFKIKEIDYRGAFNLFLALIPHRRFWNASRYCGAGLFL